MVFFEGKLTMDADIHLNDTYGVVGVLYTHNRCCENKPYLLTINSIEKSADRPEGVNYSCQCSCGMWCTSGHATPEDAIAEYEHMCEMKDGRGEIVGACFINGGNK